MDSDDRKQINNQVELLRANLLSATDATNANSKVVKATIGLVEETVKNLHHHDVKVNEILAKAEKTGVRQQEYDAMMQLVNLGLNQLELERK